MTRVGCLLFVLTVGPVVAAPDTEFDPATTATNKLGLELFRSLAAEKPDQNLLISPYSIESALALAYAGAAGETRKEMSRVLHLPVDESSVQMSFNALRNAFDKEEKEVAAQARGSSPESMVGNEFELHAANGLYCQQGFAFRESFIKKLQTGYGAKLELVNFHDAPEVARGAINQWVEQQTHNRIREIIPEGGVDAQTRIALINAIYFKANWTDSFSEEMTKPRQFFIANQSTIDVPTMNQSSTSIRYREFRNFVAVAIPYSRGAVQFLVILPDKGTDVETVLGDLSAGTLQKFTPGAFRSRREDFRQSVDLFLPRVRIEGATASLESELEKLGMKTAFDQPSGSANFDGIWPKTAGRDYACISNLFHKAFLALDEKGTEAAASTGIIVLEALGLNKPPPPPPIIVHVDRPFLFIIQHCESGACLFIGRVTDPR